MAKAKRKAAAEAVAPVAPAAAPVTDDQRLELLLQSLHETTRQLLGVDPSTLTDDEHEQWRKQVNSVNLAISKVRNARLAALSAEISAELPSLQDATDQLAKSLADLKEANEIIAAVAEGIGVVTQILTLFA